MSRELLWNTRPAFLLMFVVLTVLFAGGYQLACSGEPQAGVKAPQRTGITGEEKGFDDTPFLPGGQWRVHDIRRPHPRVVTPGPAPAEPVAPPSDAIMLFDGKDLSGWEEVGGKPARWKVENGYMEIARGAGHIQTREKFGDAQYHVEWASPAEIRGSSQNRGNSGVLIMGMYEIQVLNSYENVTYADGQAAAMYGQYPPLVNASRKPGEWQTYDIVFEAPRFEGEKLIKPAHVTVLHNGIVVHHRQPFIGRVVYREVAQYRPHPPEGPLQLQQHGSPVRFRNIWVRKLRPYDEP